MIRIIEEVIQEETKLKRIARYGEFDNGHVLFGDWKKMTSEEAEEKARQLSIEHPDDIYYVKYDDLMNPCSDYRSYKGRRYYYTDLKRSDVK